MSVVRALLLIVVVWCAIYLPGLGTLEIKGEEGRRILPAVTMLQTGNYVVPRVGSDPYLRKPPLINWLVAASFKVFGKRDEWTARIPSALCVLAVAIAFVTVARRSLGANGSLIAAFVWMTNFGMIEKGRLIEIEALYVSLCGLAIICWLSWWQERRSPWLTWTVPWIFLGVGLLAKGPLHLLFFYAVVLAVLYRTGEVRTIWNRAHLIGILLMLGIFAAWAVPYLQMMPQSEVAQVWTRQFSGRLSGEDFKFSGWIMNIPRGLGYFLPWTLMLLFARRAKFSDQRNARLLNGLLLGIGISFVAVSLPPGSLSRYTMPLLAPAAWATAMILTSQALAWPRWPVNMATEFRLPAFVTSTAIIVIALYAFAAMPHLERREKIRNIAASLNAALPPMEPLYAIDPDYQPFLFYVRDPIVYLGHIREAPNAARYLLVQPENERQALESSQWQPRKALPIRRFKDYRNKEAILVEIGTAG